MKVVSIKEMKILELEVLENGETIYYRRLGFENFEELMGQSWEPCFSKERVLEELFIGYYRGSK